MRVVIVGMGALGSHLLLFARNWEADLRVIDFDKVESKNTQSQFHTKMGQGKQKSMALMQGMQGMWGLKIHGVVAKVGTTNLECLLGDADLVIDCTDNFKARDIIQEYCGGLGINCLHGCLSADGGLARIVWTEDFKPDKEDVDGDATCEDGRNVAFHALAGAMIAQIAQKYLEEEVKQSWQLTPFSMNRLT